MGDLYPGFYAAAGMIDHHPRWSLCPQGPSPTGGCDFITTGLLFAFNFLATFGRPRPERTKVWGPRFDHKTRDGYAFLDLGLENARTRHLGDDNKFWNALVEHPTTTSSGPRETSCAPEGLSAVMTVGGWFDEGSVRAAEDLSARRA